MKTLTFGKEPFFPLFSLLPIIHNLPQMILSLKQFNQQFLQVSYISQKSRKIRSQLTKFIQADLSILYKIRVFVRINFVWPYKHAWIEFNNLYRSYRVQRVVKKHPRWLGSNGCGLVNYSSRQGLFDTNKFTTFEPRFQMLNTYFSRLLMISKDPGKLFTCFKKFV